MSSTQRSRAIAALASLVTLLAVAAVLSSVLSGNNGDTAATGTSVSPPPPPSVEAANLQVDAANLRASGSRGSRPTVPARVDGSRATQPTIPATVTTASAAGRKKTSTTVVKLPVAAAPAAGATSPTTQPTTATSAKPGSSTMPVANPPAASTPPASVPATQPKGSVTSSTTVATVPSTATTAKPTTTTIATTSTTAATQPPPPATGGMNAIELEIARMTNELRTNPNGPLARTKPAPSCVQVDGGGKVVAVPALTLSESVSVNMSRAWSMDMNSRNTMDHRSQASTNALYAQLGISHRGWGENVAWLQGYSDAQAAQVMFQGWRESDGHYCNMMSASFNSFGVGVYKGSSRTWGTQNFYATR